ncbi:MAG: hypothetical protein NDJ90_00715 [Oligoflexia bacterium]|nr:hypothetical protein [Oligoflexia bacterium]
MILALCTLLIGATPALAGFSTELALHPRLESIWSAASESSHSQRGVLKAEGRWSWGAFQVFGEGFVEGDLAKTPALQRRSRSSAILQELYGEFKLKDGDLILRAGLQAVRWSDGWVLPSLDLWTARRYNRLFLDPTSEQLVHPAGVLLIWNSAALSSELSAFVNVKPAEDRLPEPLPEKLEEKGPAFGFRAKTRLGGFDLTAVGALTREPGSADVTGGAADGRRLQLGASVNYALDAWVPRLELGTRGEREFYGSFGADFFPSADGLGDGSWSLSLLPQLTTWRTGSESRQLGYLALRLSNEANAWELQGYRELADTGDQFLSLLYKRAFRAPAELEASVFAQNYDGPPQSLFGIYEELLGGYAVGIRLEAHGVL